MANIRRQKQKAKKREERLNNLDSFGNRDRTPQEAVQNIIDKNRGERV